VRLESSANRLGETNAHAKATKEIRVFKTVMISPKYN